MAEYLLSKRNKYLQYQTSVCSMFPTVDHLKNCSYCHGQSDFFASPGCWALQEKMERSLVRSICIEADLSYDVAARQSYTNLIACLGADSTACFSNFTAAGLGATEKLKKSGFPASYLADYEAGGRLWQKGLKSRLNIPMSYTHAWRHTPLNAELIMIPWGTLLDERFLGIVDAVMTAIVGYNEFIRLGGLGAECWKFVSHSNANLRQISLRWRVDVHKLRKIGRICVELV